MIHSFTRRRRLAWFAIGAASLFALGLWGCSTTDNSPVSSDLTGDAGLSLASPRVQAVMSIQELHTQGLMAKPDVIGTAVTVDENNQPAVMLLVTTQAAFDAAPKTLDGVPVKVVLTDKIVAMRTSGGVSHTAKQTPPIKLGTSGGWRYDLANGYCCAGTLGSLISVGGQKRILSNYHVFEADIVSGGNSRVAATGDYIIQPGLIDVGCNAASAQNVATLVKSSSLPNSNVDCFQRQYYHGHGGRHRQHSGNRRSVRNDRGGFSQPDGQEERPHDRSYSQLCQRSECDHQRVVRE